MAKKRMLIICDDLPNSEAFLDHSDWMVTTLNYKNGMNGIEGTRWDKIVVAGKLPEHWTLGRVALFCRPEGLIIAGVYR